MVEETPCKSGMTGLKSAAQIPAAVQLVQCQDIPGSPQEGINKSTDSTRKSETLYHDLMS